MRGEQRQILKRDRRITFFLTEKDLMGHRGTIVADNDARP